METQLVQAWRAIDRDEDSLRYLDELEHKKAQDLVELLDPARRLTFGTAGLRGKLQPGFSSMNAVVVIQTAQGLLSYCRKRFPEQTASGGICVAHDARHQSAKFAAITAGIFIAGGVQVHYFPGLAPTPYCAFFTLHFGCAAGVMVTASHNPCEYNGYKVYGMGCGVQIIEPVDREIQEEIMANLEIYQQSWEYERFLGADCHHGLLHRLDEKSPEVQAYYDAIGRICFRKQFNARSTLRAAYSAMWGVGCVPFKRAAAVFGFDTAGIHFLEGSCLPDPDFGGTKRPNPEETANMLQLADQCGDDVELVLVNDPDADRLALMEYDSSAQEFYIFHGNEIGIVLCHYIIEMTGDVPDRCLACSTVSTQLLKKIAQENACEFRDTLTGLKWIGRQNQLWRAEGKNMVFGFEEAIGYTCGTRGGLVVGDKDGVSAACVAMEMAAWLKGRRMTVKQYLHEICSKYGYVAWENGGFTVESMQEVAYTFELLLQGDGKFTAPHGRAYISAIGQFQVLRVRDLRAPGYDSQLGKPDLPCAETEMLTLYCGSVTCTLRPSGTEPKLKYYIEARSEAGVEAAKDVAEEFQLQFLRALHRGAE